MLAKYIQIQAMFLMAHYVVITNAHSKFVYAFSQ